MNDDTQDQILDTTEPTEEVVTPTVAENSDEESSPIAEETTVSEETTPAEEVPSEETTPADAEEVATDSAEEPAAEDAAIEEPTATEEDIASLNEDVTDANPNARWYVVHTYSGHENKVATALKQRVESEHLEHKILDVIVPTQDKIEIRSGKKATVKEKIFPGYILVKMDLDDNSWLAVRTTQGVTGFVGIGNKPTPIPEPEVKTIVRFMTQGAAPTFKDVFMVDDTVKIVDGPFSEFIGKVDSVDKEKGKVRVLVSIFGRETPVELDFLQVQKL